MLKERGTHSGSMTETGLGRRSGPSTSKNIGVDQEKVMRRYLELAGTDLRLENCAVSLLGRPQTYRLIAAFLKSEGRPVSRGKLVEALYGVKYRCTTRSKGFWEAKDRCVVKQVSRARQLLDEWFGPLCRDFDCLSYDQEAGGWSLAIKSKDKNLG